MLNSSKCFKSKLEIWAALCFAKYVFPENSKGQKFHFNCETDFSEGGQNNQCSILLSVSSQNQKFGQHFVSQSTFFLKIQRARNFISTVKPTFPKEHLIVVIFCLSFSDGRSQLNLAQTSLHGKKTIREFSQIVANSRRLYFPKFLG